MIYEFKSKATGSVVMTQPVAEQMLSIIGKEPGPQGIITVEQMPAAVAALEQAIAQQRAAGDDRASAAGSAAPQPSDAADPVDEVRVVSLGQRAWPLIEMLRDAHKARRDITWGV